MSLPPMHPVLEKIRALRVLAARTKNQHEADTAARQAARLVEKHRLQDQAELKRYIETDLNAAKQLAEVAQTANRLSNAADNLNVASSSAGSESGSRGLAGSLTSWSGAGSWDPSRAARRARY